MWIYYIVMIAIIGLDQLVKWLTVHQFPVGSGQPLIPGVLSLFHIQNHGAAWGIFEGKMWFFFIVTVVVVGCLLWMLHTQTIEERWYSLSLALIIAGAIGNFIDRMCLGYVVDMFKTEFIDFPIFNVADIAITCGVILLLISLLLGKDGEIH
ncbi:signal peptidase II [Aerococcus vaginalis]